MDLDEVEVLSACHSRSSSRGSVGRGHEHSLLAVDVVDRGHLCVDEVGKDRQAPVGGPVEPRSTVEAPSVSGVELPAVMVASSPVPKTGRSLASWSTEVSGRRVASRSARGTA